MATSSRSWPLLGSAGGVALAAGVALVVIGNTALRAAAVPGGLTPLAWLPVLVASAVIFFRTRFPVVVAVTTLVCGALHYPLSSVDGPIMLTFFLALYTVATGGHLVAGIVLAAIAMLAVGYGEVRSGTRHLDDTALYLFGGWLVATIAAGGATHQRRAYLHEAQQRVLAAEREKEQEARGRATEERLRIARELHDVLGHNISLINVQASAALHRLDAESAQAEEALQAIKTSSKDALRELRATLGVLRQVDEEAPTAPVPGLARLDELLAQARSGGLIVRAETDGPLGALSPEVDAATYRIVQESLTNVVRHADAGTALVRIGLTEDDVRVEIVDDGRGSASGAGSGIRGMEERTRALGGEFLAENAPGQGFRVLARLPRGATT